MTWVLVAAFLFNDETTVMSDQKFYSEYTECQKAVQYRRELLEATKPITMSDAVYWVWCAQIPQDI
jgi:hypothetical protein